MIQISFSVAGSEEGVALPETSYDRYSCYEEPLTRQADMITGRRVLEAIGDAWKVWRVKWSYDVLPDDIYQKILPILRSGAVVSALVLPDTGAEPVLSSFVVDSLTPPTYLIEDGGRAVWRGLGFTLREERPHA